MVDKKNNEKKKKKNTRTRERGHCFTYIGIMIAINHKKLKLHIPERFRQIIFKEIIF